MQSSSFTYPITARVVGAPQMTSNQFPLFFSVLHCSETRPVHSLMVSSHLFFCPNMSSSPFHCAMRDSSSQTYEQETCPYHFSSSLFAIARTSSCGPIACWILAITALGAQKIMADKLTNAHLRDHHIAFDYKVCERDRDRQTDRQNDLWFAK